MDVNITNEMPLRDPLLSQIFPYVSQIYPSEKSFYSVIGYSILAQLGRVPVNDRKRTIGSIKKYLCEGSKQNFNPALNQEGLKLLEILDKISSNPNTNMNLLLNFLKEKITTITMAFQLILAEIFAQSHKNDEAQGILKGESVIPSNKYYFQNFANSLCIRICLYRLGESSEEVFTDDEANDLLNISIYACSIRPPGYAIVRHLKEAEFDQTGDNRIARSLPIMLTKKPQGPFVPLGMQAPPVYTPSGPPVSLIVQAPPGYTPSGVSVPPGVQAPPAYNPPGPSFPPGVQAPPAYNPPGPSFLPDVQAPPAYNPPGPSFPPGVQAPPVYTLQGPPPGYVPQESLGSYGMGPPKIGDRNISFKQEKLDLSPENNLLDHIFSLFIEYDLLVNHSQAKTFKKLMKSAKKADKSLVTDSFEEFYSKLKPECNKKHDQSEYVIFETCKKRHCKLCLKERSSKEVICDCKSKLSQKDCSFHLKLNHIELCALCEQPLTGNTAWTRSGKPVHRECLE
jgi:hypothetical protein